MKAGGRFPAAVSETSFSAAASYKSLVLTRRDSMRSVKHTLHRLLCVLFLSSAGLCWQNAPPKQSQQPSGTNAPAKEWLNEWRNATVSFGNINRDSLINREFFQAVGTGVIVRTDEHTAYIVTARHMFCDVDERWHPRRLNIRFAWEDRKSTYQFFGIPIELRDGSGNDLWKSLDDGTDIAVIQIQDAIMERLPPEDRLERYRAIGLENLSDEIYEGAQILVLGYPGLVGKDRLVRAIVRQGIVAWTNPNHPHDGAFLVDSNLYPGNSGGPVIKLPFGLTKEGMDFIRGGKIKLLGIVSQVVSQDINISGRKAASVYGIGGIGVIEPASKITQLLQTIQSGTAKAPHCEVPDARQSRNGQSTKSRAASQQRH